MDQQGMNFNAVGFGELLGFLVGVVRCGVQADLSENHRGNCHTLCKTFWQFLK